MLLKSLKNQDLQPTLYRKMWTSKETPIFTIGVFYFRICNLFKNGYGSYRRAGASSDF